MFNAMSEAEVVLAVGRVLREAAAHEGEADEYHRSQLLSAYSVARHLAAEQIAAPALHAWFREAVASELEGERAQAVRAAHDAERLGEIVADVLAELRAEGTPAAGERRARLHALLGELCEREVAALAEPPR